MRFLKKLGKNRKFIIIQADEDLTIKNLKSWTKKPKIIITTKWDALRLIRELTSHFKLAQEDLALINLKKERLNKFFVFYGEEGKNENLCRAEANPKGLWN